MRVWQVLVLLVATSAAHAHLATVQTPEFRLYEIEITLPLLPSGPAVLQVTDGSYVSCADVTVISSAPFEINAGLNDAWYYPATDESRRPARTKETPPLWTSP